MGFKLVVCASKKNNVDSKKLRLKKRMMKKNTQVLNVLERKNEAIEPTWIHNERYYSLMRIIRANKRLRNRNKIEEGGPKG